MQADETVDGMAAAPSHPVTVQVINPGKGIRGNVATGLIAGIIAIAGIVPVAGAATKEEMIRLNAAYPPGSIEVCRQSLPGNGKMRLPTILEIRGTVVIRDENSAVYDVSSTWTIAGKSNPGLTLRLRMQQRMGDEGSYSLIDPGSMKVLMPMAGSEGEKAVLEGFRRRLPASETFTPFSVTEITDFPSYEVHRPGEPPAHCHKESARS